MHIVILPSEEFMTKNSPLGGIFQLHQAKALSNAGYKVGLICSGTISPKYIFKENSYVKYEEIDNIHIYRKYKKRILINRLVSIPNQIKSNFDIFDKLFKDYIAIHGKPDIVHAHNFLYAGLVALKIKQKYNIPYILTEHSSAFARKLISPRIDKYLKEAYANASVVTAVSSKFASLLNKRTNIEIKVLHNIVDYLFFKKNKIIANKDKFIFLNIAKLDSNKNHKLLLESFASSFKNKNVVLKIGGGGILEIQLKELSKKLNIETQVEFLGILDHSNVKSEMDSADCFVLSSDYETFGVVLIEALACGLPIIATKSGGPEDIINNGNGILVDINEQKQLASAMEDVYKNINNYNAQILREEAKDRFGKDIFVENVTKYYDMVNNNDR
jgi:glycosyltransferase involved in cell wall biosynthesis